MEMASAFTLNVRLDNIAIITIDVPDEKMNTLKAEFASQVRAIIKQLRCLLYTSVAVILFPAVFA